MGGARSRIFSFATFLGRPGKGRAGRAAGPGKSRASHGARLRAPSDAVIAEAISRMLESAESPFEPLDSGSSDPLPLWGTGKWETPQNAEISWLRFPGVREGLRRLVSVYLLSELPWLRLMDGGLDEKIPYEYGPAAFFATLVLYDALLLSRAEFHLASAKGASKKAVFDMARVNVKNHLEGLVELKTRLRSGDLVVLAILFDQARAAKEAFDAFFFGPVEAPLSALGEKALNELIALYGKGGKRPEEAIIDEASERLGRIGEELFKLEKFYRNPPDDALAELCCLVFENEALSSLAASRILEGGRGWLPAGRVFATAQKMLDEAMTRAALPQKDAGSAARALEILRFFAFFGAGYFRRCMESESWPETSGLKGCVSEEILLRHSMLLRKELSWCAGYELGGLDVLHDRTARLFKESRRYSGRL